jgi:hypothetical protein
VLLVFDIPIKENYEIACGPQQGHLISGFSHVLFFLLAVATRRNKRFNVFSM